MKNKLKEFWSRNHTRVINAVVVCTCICGGACLGKACTMSQISSGLDKVFLVNPKIEALMRDAINEIAQKKG